MQNNCVNVSSGHFCECRQHVHGDVLCSPKLPDKPSNVSLAVCIMDDDFVTIACVRMLGRVRKNMGGDKTLAVQTVKPVSTATVCNCSGQRACTCYVAGHTYAFKKKPARMDNTVSRDKILRAQASSSGTEEGSASMDTPLMTTSSGAVRTRRAMCALLPCSATRASSAPSSSTRGAEATEEVLRALTSSVSVCVDVCLCVRSCQCAGGTLMHIHDPQMGMFPSVDSCQGRV
jgi:hypothetical protein